MLARFVVLIVSGLLPACVLGSEPTPGCRPDHASDCDQGWTCRGGVCVRPTTPLSPPADAADQDVAQDANPDTDA
ncbi:MAG: hypothetical protein CVU63_02965 [Deltaproteobacteria bacterium HGW-Deltaproteobacteria-20]|jgi:hypothetical protein|nr:MAG: hypothetical protein CVU63_02965 [Deltaproteobacteria bacterium HGW-Deltaproteobacteria-20]